MVTHPSRASHGPPAAYRDGDDAVSGRPYRGTVTTVYLPDQLSPAIVRARPHVEAVLAQSLREMGLRGRTALAWQWALTGTRPSPVTLSLAPGRPPSREEILAEAAAEPEGSTAPPGVPADFRDQFRETRAVLAWLAGGTDEIPVHADNRGRFIGARGDYVRTDDEMRLLRDLTRDALQHADVPDPMSASDARHPWRWEPGWMNAAWLRGVRDLLDWVLGESPAAPLGGQTVGLPSTSHLHHEDAAANLVVLQGRPAVSRWTRTGTRPRNTARASRPRSAGCAAKPQPPRWTPAAAARICTPATAAEIRPVPKSDRGRRHGQRRTAGRAGAAQGRLPPGSAAGGGHPARPR